MPGPDALSIFLRPKVLLEFDLALNVLFYLPLGAIACLILQSPAGPWAARTGSSTTSAASSW